jgi:hypothetical protein
MFIGLMAEHAGESARRARSKGKQAMRKVMCTIHEGQISKPQIHDLEVMIKRVYRDRINSEQRLFLVWTEMPMGQGFTEAKPSRVSWVMVEVDDHFDQQKREAAMKTISEEWARIAKVSTGNLMLTIADTSQFSRLAQAMQERIAPGARLGFILKLIIRLILSKLRNGYFEMKANY